MGREKEGAAIVSQTTLPLPRRVSATTDNAIFHITDTSHMSTSFSLPFLPLLGLFPTTRIEEAATSHGKCNIRL